MRQRLRKTIAALALAAAMLLADMLPVSACTAESCAQTELYAASSVAAPSASKKSGTIQCAANSTSIKLTADGGATIYYSLNGDSYKKYSSAIKLTKNSTLKTYAVKNGRESSVATYNYKLKPNVSFSVSGSGSKKTVQLSSGTNGVKLYYTTDGSKPTTSSKRYPSSGVTITKSCKLRVLAVKSGWSNASFSKKYTVKGSAGVSTADIITKSKETRTCKACFSGSCWDCSGSGQEYNYIIGMITCSTCKGTGNCNVCNGTHEISVECNVINENAVPEDKIFKKCAYCDGSGICAYCNGGKKYYGADCIQCKASGKCRTCDGSGGNLADKPKPNDNTGGSTGGNTGGNTGGSTGGGGTSGGICFTCGGTGNCQRCYGRNICPACSGRGGQSYNTWGQGGTGWVNCTACNGRRTCPYCSHGECRTCGGSGRR